MSERETQISISLQQWRGVDQRTSPTRVQDGFFVMSRGVFFGLGENAERVPGKRLSGLMDDAVFNLVQFGDRVLVQTMTKLLIGDVSEFVGFDLTFTPDVPGLVSFSNIGHDSVDVTMPGPSLPDHTVSLSLERSLDDSTWVTVGTGLAALQIVNDTGLTPLTQYFYRAVAVGVVSSVNGPSDDVTTIAAPLTFNRITEVGDIRITEAGDTRITE